MTRWLIVVVLLLTTGCTAQNRCFTRIEIYNSCPFPLHTTLENHSNLGDENHKSFDIASGATVLGGEIYGINCDLNRSVLDGYKITFDTNTAHKEMNRSEIVGKLISNHQKSTRDSRYWLLDTGDFCR
ncbi:MAG: hypothetical protein H6R15_4081 [Proteobacteria bacterium]|nr:hypothetical protein [Pseudomonadota bacterium]